MKNNVSLQAVTNAIDKISLAIIDNREMDDDLTANGLYLAAEEFLASFFVYECISFKRYSQFLDVLKDAWLSSGEACLDTPCE